jgi:hypothetical protein
MATPTSCVSGSTGELDSSCHLPGRADRRARAGHGTSVANLDGLQGADLDSLQGAQPGQPPRVPGPLARRTRRHPAGWTAIENRAVNDPPGSAWGAVPEASASVGAVIGSRQANASPGGTNTCAYG